MKTRPRTIEIAGVAGSGKSTLARALERRCPGARVADSLHTRLPAHWPYVAHGLPRVLPFAARGLLAPPPPSWDELKFALYVLEWDRYLRARTEHRQGLTVLDQGPVFALARLLWGAKPLTRGEWFRGWLQQAADRWSGELDAIVWLTAPDDVLLERINRRGQAHDAKGLPAREALALLDTHRVAYARVLEVVDGLGRPRVLRFDTGTTPAEGVADAVAETIEAMPAPRLTDTRPGLNVG